ncbi:hypothetical protein BVC80_521g35 [Macleaya cordata]|uniref:phospholipase A2 n=1 Tax=Macleaya cordata TaxID=56857 RepID=A0A200R944_MACCD|nr:hypothetical protein BVC80_521g35 [Macleaya cordata]
MATFQSLKFVLLISCSILVLNFSTISIHALNVGVQTTGTGVSLMKECSRKCESEFCSVPPLLRYGKYCGLLYSGCPGEKPCDGLDACCMKHDVCIQFKNSSRSGPVNMKRFRILSVPVLELQLMVPDPMVSFNTIDWWWHGGADDYLSQECNQEFLNCMKNFKDMGGRTFKGNKCEVGEVVDIISVVIEAALLAGRALHKP